jgi:hypothetical protein
MLRVMVLARRADSHEAGSSCNPADLTNQVRDADGGPQEG